MLTTDFHAGIEALARRERIIDSRRATRVRTRAR
jgi:hypothetical protein